MHVVMLEKKTVDRRSRDLRPRLKLPRADRFPRVRRSALAVGPAWLARGADPRWLRPDLAQLWPVDVFIPRYYSFSDRSVSILLV